MKNCMKKCFVILGVYSVFAGFLFFASYRITRLDDNTNLKSISLKVYK